jgi:putative membrane-bound dehydrogenase-like protein
LERGRGSVREACVIPHFFHIFEGGTLPAAGGGAISTSTTYEDIQTIADHRHYLGGNPHGGNGKSDAAGGGHAHAGLCILQHPSWPEKLRGGVLMGNIHGSRINMDILERKGSGYVAHHGPDFINFRDKASQIVDIREGPDGSLFMIDWYDLNQCHRPQREAHDYTTGRIYRLAKKERSSRR